ncbi:TetR/AcrR family transcriptional regulator [Marinilabilia salmonicolor]|uniref:TetR family transcriptional regulator n=1 Tax=Marinilabilia salmonicolor TaxID=989 RepID=A0A368VAR6_9BACT|nr:TetR/AcrR family transcriptional regulator [Marinilabilia salmonicolor]RCW38327.1 TetR family transcriptional regulator [Marinilabilia salmonicolor]
MPRAKAYDKEEVLEKAMNVFWTHGYGTTSVRLLEKEMGINQFSIYSSFTSKKNLFIEALGRYREKAVSERFVPLIKEGASLKDLRLFLENFVANVQNGKARQGCLVVNTTSEAKASTDPEIACELQNYFEMVKGMLQNILINSIKAREIGRDTDIEKCSNYLLGVMQGLSVVAKNMNEKQVADYIQVALLNLK